MEAVLADLSLRRRVVALAALAASAGAAAFVVGGCGAATATSSAEPALMPRVVQSLGQGKLIRYAAAGRVGDEVVVAAAVEGRPGARREIHLTMSQRGRWISVAAPPISVGPREVFAVTGLGGRPCVLLSPKRRVGLRCLENERWRLVGTDRPLGGVREFNDVESTGTSVFATTGGTAGHRPQVRVLRWTAGRRTDLGAVDGWAAQRGYFAAPGAVPREICGAYNRYSEPRASSAPVAPVGTFCVTSDGGLQSQSPPQQLAVDWAAALPLTSETASFDTAHSARLASGAIAIATNALNSKGVGTLVTVKSPQGDWRVSPLSSEDSDLQPYGGVWAIGNDLYRLDAQISRSTGESSVVLRQDSANTTQPIQILGRAKGGFQIALGVFEIHERRYALFTTSDPAKPARTLAIPVS